MKKLIYTAAFLAIGPAVAAQPVLNSNNMAPIGFYAPLSIASPSAFDPGGAGANQTWDFTSLPLVAAGDVAIVDASNTPHFSSFPTSNYAYRITTGPNTQYNYYNVSSTGFDMLGSEIGSGDPNDYTPGPRSEMKFPFAFNDTYNDTYQTTDMGSPGTLTRTYDGYGTLITPSATYNNVVRVAYSFDGGPTRYQWLWSNPVLLLLTVNEDGTVIAIVADPLASSLPVTKAASHTMFPALVTNGFTVIENAGTVAAVELVDLTGRIVRRVDHPTSGIVDMAGISSGIYHARVTDESGVASVQKLVVQ